jgi:hypothetical protein
MADYQVQVYDNVSAKTISMAAMDAAFAVQNYGTRYSYVSSPLAKCLARRALSLFPQNRCGALGEG